jgi:hypothetical protein
MSPLRTFATVAALAAVLGLAETASAQQRVPPDARGFQRYLINQQNANARMATTVAAADPLRRTYAWDLPPSVPTDRTYSWYAPPSDMQVVIQATTSEPRYVTVVSPDGTKRTFRAEGPVVIRRPIVVRR